MSTVSLAEGRHLQKIFRGLRHTLLNRGLYKSLKDDGRWEVSWTRAYLLRDLGVVAFQVDTMRLPVGIEKLVDPDVVHQMQAALNGRRVRVTNSRGLAFSVELEPKAPEPKIHLPRRLILEPENLPEGDYTALLGRAKSGPVVLNLADSERGILVGGTSGAGKTGTIRSLVLQLAHKHGPGELALAVVDLKHLDFMALNNLPHLVRPIATEESEAEELIAWCVAEMERRQAVMQQGHITRWDRMAEGERFPLLLLLVDEAADLADSSAMRNLVRLARKGRASGVSLILATQRPDAQVLSRQVKANVTTRIAFRVTDSIESRIILDRTGAEAIERRGLALTNAGGRWRRVQCAYVPDEALGDWIDAAPTGPALSEIEKSLVAYAVQELDDAFIIGKLYEGVDGISKRRLTKLAQAWEQRGWLTAPAHAADPRRVTDELLDLAGIAPGR